MKQYLLGIDIGGTNTAFGIIRYDGTIECRFQFTTNEYSSFEALIQAIYKYLNANCAKLFDRLAGVGVGAPMIHPATGIIDGAANLVWEQPVRVKEITERIFRLPVQTNNDANIAVLGEWKFGKARGCRNVVMITLGTGVGGGLIVNDQLVVGHSGLAGEVGHMIYEPGGRPCNCGRRGCYERYISATGIQETYQEIRGDYPLSVLVEWNKEGVVIDARKIYEAALLKDALALEVYRHTGEILGMLLSNLVCCFSPEKIILFGGVMYAGEIILQPTLKYYKDTLLSNFVDTVSIEVSGIAHQDMGIVGAAALLIE